MLRRRVGMADEADSKSVVGNNVRVQVPPPASNERGVTKLCLHRVLQLLFCLMNRERDARDSYFSLAKNMNAGGVT